MEGRKEERREVCKERKRERERERERRSRKEGGGRRESQIGHLARTVAPCNFQPESPARSARQAWPGQIGAQLAPDWEPRQNGKVRQLDPARTAPER